MVDIIWSSGVIAHGNKLTVLRVTWIIQFCDYIVFLLNKTSCKFQYWSVYTLITAILNLCVYWWQRSLPNGKLSRRTSGSSAGSPGSPLLKRGSERRRMSSKMVYIFLAILSWWNKWLVDGLGGFFFITRRILLILDVANSPLPPPKSARFFFFNFYFYFWTTPGGNPPPWQGDNKQGIENLLRPTPCYIHCASGPVIHSLYKPT